jgi:hypothetical protein
MNTRCDSTNNMIWLRLQHVTASLQDRNITDIKSTNNMIWLRLQHVTASLQDRNIADIKAPAT